MVSDKWQRFRGIISAVVTPMHADESVNYAALDALARAQLARGVEGFYCCGSSGEGPLLRFDERRQVLATLVQSAGGQVPVIAHVGTPRTRDAVELAKHAEQDGASAVSLVPPYYYKYSREEIIAYYRRVLDAISIPVILYNIPQFTGVELDAQSADALLGEEQVLGVKHTSHNLYSLERMIARYPEKVFFNGFDEIFLPASRRARRPRLAPRLTCSRSCFSPCAALFSRATSPGRSACSSRSTRWWSNWSRAACSSRRSILPRKRPSIPAPPASRLWR